MIVEFQNPVNELLFVHTRQVFLKGRELLRYDLHYESITVVKSPIKVKKHRFDQCVPYATPLFAHDLGLSGRGSRSAPAAVFLLIDFNRKTIRTSCGSLPFRH